MVWLIAVITVLALVGISVAAGVWCARLDHAIASRAAVRLQQRRAEAQMDAVLRDTVQQLFDAARRQP